MKTSKTIIGEAFVQYAKALVNYVALRINDRDDAEDLVQDVFLRLLGCDVIAEATVKNLCYTIANNMVIDYIRRHYKREDVYSYYYEQLEQAHVVTPEQETSYHDLQDMESRIIMKLAPATARVYELSQHEGLSIQEISDQLGISRRTVECHQYQSRKFVREEIRKVI